MEKSCHYARKQKNGNCLAQAYRQKGSHKTLVTNDIASFILLVRVALSSRLVASSRPDRDIMPLCQETKI